MAASVDELSIIPCHMAAAEVEAESLRSRVYKSEAEVEKLRKTVHVLRQESASKDLELKKAKKGADEDDDDDFEGVRIEMNQAVTLTFSLKYLVNFSKSSSLCKKVQLMMSNDVPLLVSASYSVATLY